MTSDLAKLMEKISLLQSEPTPEPIIEIEKPTMHPLLQAMQELKEDGIIESVDPHTIFNQVKEIHREFRDIEEGDLPDRIYWFDEYKTSQIPLSQIDLNEFEVDEDLVEDYIEYIKDSPKTMPPIVYDPVAGSVIDGMHRANAYARLGYDSIPAYVGLTKSSSYGEREEIDEENTFDQERRQLNIPALIKQGAIFVTHPHGPKGWETDRPDWDFSLITLQNILQKSPNWVADYKKYISNDKKLTQDFINRISDEKYQQILWSINKLGISDDVAFADKLDEASPNTLEGSFTPDLVESKTWLAEMLAKGLKGKNAGTIYVLGSWYGNMGIFLQQAGVQFDKLVLIEPNEKWLMHSKELLDTLNDEGKLVLIHQKAEDAVYEKPGVVINTSCNETGPVFLTKLPDNMLCLLQARNNNETTLFPTEQIEDFIDYFPLKKVYYTGKKSLEDPEVNYVRYMMIGRTGKKLDEEHHTGGSLGLPFPGTYEQEYDMFKSKGQRRITAMTNESEKSFPNIVDTIVKSIPNVNEIYFHGSRAIGKGKRKSDWDILVIVDDSVVGSDYIDTVFALQDIAKEFKNFDIQPSKANSHISRNAKEEGKLLYSADQKIDEALDSSYPYVPGEKKGRYYFTTDDGLEYEVRLYPKRNASIDFAQRGSKDSFKTGLTGTGDSSKIFGTIAKMSKDFIAQYNPETFSFSAYNGEPSRVKLYRALAMQAEKELPNYIFIGEVPNGPSTQFTLKRIEKKEVSEALNSSYPYEFKNNAYYFRTDARNDYKVTFKGDKKVEVSFMARGENDQPKDDITGTGDSRKVFGTVINIVKDYVGQHQPNILMFAADNNEPSRIRLYNMLASQAGKALPGYNFVKTLKGSLFTTFYLTRDNIKVPKLDTVKNVAGRVLDKVVESDV